jgi:hypothetical protein
MGKLTKFSQGLAVAGLLCLGSLQATKADTLNYNTTITYSGTNPLTNYYNDAAPVVEAVSITNIGGVVSIQIGTQPPAGVTNGDIQFNPPPVNCSTVTPITCLSTSSPFYGFITTTSSTLTGFTIGGTAANPIVSNSTPTGFYNSPYDQLCGLGNASGGEYPNNSCNTGASPTIDVSYLNGVITVTDDSIAFSFALPTSTPEPSSLLTLGSGLLGLLGFGFRRKAIV